MTDPDTLRVLEIADRLAEPEAEALRGLARALSSVAPTVDHLGHGLVQPLEQFRVADEGGEQPVDRRSYRLETGRLG